jgi:CheY-like chemotaxis protein
MPVMDGLEATRAIREMEASAGRHTRIVAMTAHSLKGDRERCLEGGMDAYISKPVQIQALIEVVEGEAAGAQTDLWPPESHRTPLVDREAVLSRVGGDPVLLGEVVDLFLRDSAELVNEMREAVKAGDAARLTRAAHTLKGTAANLGAESVRELALKLEQMGGAGDAAEISKTLGAVESALAKAGPLLRAMCVEAAA